MAKAHDPEALDCYRKVLLALGHVTGYIQWRRLPSAWLHRELRSVLEREVHKEMQAHVRSGGKIDQVPETRQEYRSYRYHYNLRLPISGRRVYIETVLIQSATLEDCTIWVVNMHDA